MSTERDKVKLRSALLVDSPRPLTSVIAAFLIKLAKHTALLACLVIAGIGTGRSGIGEVGIFLMVVVASVSYSIGRSLERRSPRIGP